MRNTEKSYDRYDEAEAGILWEDRAELNKYPVMLTESERDDVMALLRGEYGEIRLGGVSLAYFARLADEIGTALPFRKPNPEQDHE